MISSSIPGVTIGADRAAMKILEACRHGDPSLTITPHAKLAAAANAVVPAAVARAMMLVTRALPRENGPAGNATRTGLQNEAKSRWTPSVVTRLTDSAALANNEI